MTVSIQLFGNGACAIKQSLRSDQLKKFLMLFCVVIALLVVTICLPFLPGSKSSNVNIAAAQGYHKGHVKIVGDNDERTIDYAFECGTIQNITRYSNAQGAANDALIETEMEGMNCTFQMGCMHKGNESFCHNIEPSKFHLFASGEIDTDNADANTDMIHSAAAPYISKLLLKQEDDTNWEVPMLTNEGDSAVFATRDFLFPNAGLTVTVKEELIAEDSDSGIGSYRSLLFLQGSFSSPNTSSSHFEVKSRAKRTLNSQAKNVVTDLAQAPIISGIVKDTFRRHFGAGLFLKVDEVVTGSGGGNKWYEPKYDYSVTRAEAQISTLPDLHATLVVPPALNAMQDGYDLEMGIDFTSNGECLSTIQGTAHAYVYARACIGYWWWGWREWCYLKLKLDERVGITLNPYVEVNINLKPAANLRDLQTTWSLKKVGVEGWNAEYGGVEVSTGFALLLPVDFLLKKLIEDIVDNMIDAYVDNGPTVLANMLEDQIKSKLPPDSTIDNAGAALVASHIMYEAYSGESLESVQLLAAELSNIGGTLQSAPELFQPNKVACDGEGLIDTIQQECLEDFGENAKRDNLEIYCYNGFQRFCLSGELCPWREIGAAECASNFELASCSIGGLKDVNMAIIEGTTPHSKRHCKGWWLWRRCWTEVSCSGDLDYTEVGCEEGSVTLS